MGIFNSLKDVAIEYRIEKIQKAIAERLTNIKTDIEKNKKIQKKNDKSFNIYNKSEEQIEEIEPKYIILCERYKHTPEEVLKIVIDWNDFLINCYDIILRSTTIGYSKDLEEFHIEDKKQKYAILKMGEIKKRFDELLKNKTIEKDNEEVSREEVRRFMARSHPTKESIEFGRMACEATVESLRSLGNDKKSKNKSIKKLITLIPTKGKSPKQILKEAEKHLKEKGYLKEKEECEITFMPKFQPKQEQSKNTSNKDVKITREEIRKIVNRIPVTEEDIKLSKSAADAIVKSLRSLGNDKKSENKSMK